MNGVPHAHPAQTAQLTGHPVDVVTAHLLTLPRHVHSYILGAALALDHIDEVISIIRSSRTDTQASERLIESLAASRPQRFSRCAPPSYTGLERI